MKEEFWGVGPTLVFWRGGRSCEGWKKEEEKGFSILCVFWRVKVKSRKSVFGVFVVVVE